LVTSKFARIENDKIRKAREKSFNYLSQMENEESWCESFWYKKNSTTAELERQKMFCTNNMNSVGALNLSSAEYLSSLISKEKTDRNIDSMLPNPVVCLYKLKDMSLVDQIKVILKNGECIDDYFGNVVFVLKTSYFFSQSSVFQTTNGPSAR
jgi:DNA-directed RNA polymerase-3 subunit RPC5